MAGIRELVPSMGREGDRPCWAPGDTVILIKTLDSVFINSVSNSGGM